MWRDLISAIGTLIAIYTYWAYIKTILAGESKPHRVTWAGWTLVGLLGIVSSIRGGAGVGLVVTATFALGVAVIFILSCFPGYGKPGGTKLDLLAGVVAAAALLTQLFVDYSPNVGQTLAVAADVVFLWPTVREAWRHPEFEAARPWIIGASGEALGIAALGNYSYGSAAYSVYLLIGNLLVIVALKATPWSKKTKKSTKKRWHKS